MGPAVNVQDNNAIQVPVMEQVQPSVSGTHKFTGTRPKIRSNITYSTKNNTRQKILPGSTRSKIVEKPDKSILSTKKSQSNQELWKQHSSFWKDSGDIMAGASSRNTR